MPEIPEEEIDPWVFELVDKPTYVLLQRYDQFLRNQNPEISDDERIAGIEAVIFAPGVKDIVKQLDK